MKEKIAKATEQILYDTITYPETDNLYYKNHRQYEFKAKILAVLKNVTEKEKGNNIVILESSAFYPTSGGQIHDLGTLKIGEKTYDVYNVEKVGKCFLHFLSKEVDVGIIGQEA